MSPIFLSLYDQEEKSAKHVQEEGGDGRKKEKKKEKKEIRGREETLKNETLKNIKILAAHIV